MNVEFGPNSVEEPNLLYRLQRKLKVFNTGDSLPNRGYSLVACSSKFGLVFVGSPIATLSVYYLKDLIDKDCEPKCLTVKLPEKPTHIATNCDFELLAVIGGALLCIYKVTDFQGQNVSPAVTIKTEVSPSTFVSSLQWNPCVPDNISVAFFDGTLFVSQVTSAQVKKVQSKARCICWSPKGKQIVTGNSDGTLCQYKPDLTPAKMVPAPNLFEGSPVEALAIYWISTFQFAVVFKNAVDNSRPVVTIVNTPKAGQPSCLNYEDICYSMGNNRPWYYYLMGVAQWNMILSSSSNSMEIATIASTDGNNWMQWCQSDESRPELPLTNKKIENYPVGVCVDTCAIHQLPWGENETLPPMPLLHVVSQSGLLTVFNVINLKKEAAQVCAPPQQIALPTAAMTSEIPNDLPAQNTQAPAPPADVPSKPQEHTQSQAAPFSFAPAAAAAAAVAAEAAATNVVKPFSLQTSSAHQHQQTFAAPTLTAQLTQAAENKQAEAKTVLNIPQPQASQQPQQAPPAPKPTQAQTQEMNAALKAEQERNKLKADQELRNMLVKEVNDFQTELYKFAVKTREVQIKLQKDIASLDSNLNFQSLDAEKLKKECAIDDLRSAIAALKLELVRACAFVAEARTHTEAKELNQWTQVDPLTSKRVASVKKLAYYVQNQLDQAHKALDYKWNEMTLSDPKLNKPGQRMIRPVLEDVYQPLVRQQEILSRQQAVIRTLKNTLKECDSAPMFKSTSLLRSTPFRNKDPLSKLTKNILNMSIDPQKKSKNPAMSAQKLDALRDMLSNHRPLKIKPASIEIQQHLAGMRLNYEKSVKEKVSQENVQKKVEQYQVQETMIPQQMKTVQPQPVQIPAKPVQQAFQVTKPDLVSKQAPSAAFTPVNMMKPTAVPGFANVARTLFTDEPKSEPIKSPPSQSTPPPQPKFSFAPNTNTAQSPNTRSVLKDMLQNKMASSEPKNDNNTFMGQKICSPINFAASTPTQSQPSNSSTSKPLSDMNKMFSKFTPQSFAPDPKAQVPAADTTKATKHQLDTKTSVSAEKQQTKATNLINQMKSTSKATTSVSDVLKLDIASSTKVPEKSVEEKPEEGQVKQETAVKEELNQVTVSATFKLPSKPAATTITSSGDTKKPVEEKSELTITIAKPNASSLFAAANAASPTAEKPSLFGSPGTPTSSPTSLFAQTKPSVETTIYTPAEPTKPAFSSSPNASSLFVSATPSSPKSQPSGSIFTSTPAFSSTPNSNAKTEAPSASSTSGPATPESVTSSTPASPSELFAAAAAVVTTQSAFSSSAASPMPAFGSPSTTSLTPNVFGTTATTVSGSLFGTTPSSPTPGIFAAATTSQSFFGTTTTTPQSLFGGATTVTAFSASPSPSAFGTATTQSPVFGSNQTSPATSLFGAAVASQAPAFGATTTASAFGAPTTATAFGTQAASAFGTTTTQSPFGKSTATPFGSSTPSVFGGGSSQAASVFGGATQTTQASVFGGTSPGFGATPATTPSGSLFGNDNNLFGAATISTTSASSPTSGGSLFGGGASSTGSVFGGGSQTNAFGQSNTTAASIFGGGGATTFGQKPATNLWGNANNNSAGASGFGATTFGQQPTTQASSLFGSGGSFSAPSTGQAFGSPSTGSVFGSPQQQNAQAFGGTPAFGAKPAFGQPSGFGSPPSGGGFGGFSSMSKNPSSAFGGTPAFGAPAFGSTSPGKMFGGGGASSGFGAPTQSSSTFETLATQNTLSFGNLAQQSPPPAQQTSTFNASPSFTGWRG